MYISRRRLERTIFSDANRNKFDKGPAPVGFRRGKQVRDPTHLAAMDRLPTNHRRCATDRKHGSHLRSDPENQRELDERRVTLFLRELADDKRERQFSFLILFREPATEWKEQKIAACGRSRDGGNPAIAASLRYFHRLRWRYARW